jgi:glycosyltransferase involved in cell wall biosynthesis
VHPDAVAIGTQAFAPPMLGPRLQVGPRPDRFQLLFVGKHERRKGLQVLAEALRSLPACLRTQLSLVTAGDGPLAAELRAGCPPEIDLHMLGFQSPMTLAHLYRNADAMILPSLHDPWGNVANESMALGTPVIASRQCGCRELVEPTGWIVDARDAGSIATGIATAMNEARSTVRRKAAVACEAGYRPAPAARRMATLIQSL